MFHSYVIIDTDEKNRLAYIAEQLKTWQVGTQDIEYIMGEKIGISEIRQAKEHLARKPFASLYKAIIIAADFLTPEAQQALLKSLEEPPAHSILILHATTTASLLPTILSRCHIINLKTTAKNETSPALDWSFWTKLLPMDPVLRLTQTNTIPSDREEFAQWIIQEANAFRPFLRNPENAPISEFKHTTAYEILRTCQRAYKRTRANISMKLVVDHFFLELPYLKKDMKTT